MLKRFCHIERDPSSVTNWMLNLDPSNDRGLNAALLESLRIHFCSFKFRMKCEVVSQIQLSLQSGSSLVVVQLTFELIWKFVLNFVFSSPVSLPPSSLSPSLCIKPSPSPVLYKVAVTTWACTNLLFLPFLFLCCVLNCVFVLPHVFPRNTRVYLRLWMICSLSTKLLVIQVRLISALCFLFLSLSTPFPSYDPKQKHPPGSKLRVAHGHWLSAMLRPHWKLQGEVWDRNRWRYRCVTPGRWEVCVMVMMTYIDSRFYIWIYLS